MGFVTNKWQPINAGPGPTPVPAWELVKSGVTATTNFNYSNLDYTEYLILVYNKNSTSSLYEMFYAPAFGTLSQNAGSTSQIIRLTPQSNSTLTFSVTNTSSATATSNYRYIIYGRKKASWSLVSDLNALPNYTELATTGGYYTPFNYQDGNYRRAGGGTWYYKSGSTYQPQYQGAVEQVASNQYFGNSQVYTRESSNSANWNHITSTSSSVSIADISYSEMFIVARRMQHNYGGTNYHTYQSLYVIPEMNKGSYGTGGYTAYSNSKYSGSYGTITTSNTSISASCTYLNYGTREDWFEKLDIYYR